MTTRHPYPIARSEFSALEHPTIENSVELPLPKGAPVITPVIETSSHDGSLLVTFAVAELGSFSLSFDNDDQIWRDEADSWESMFSATPDLGEQVYTWAQRVAERISNRDRLLVDAVRANPHISARVVAAARGDARPEHRDRSLPAPQRGADHATEVLNVYCGRAHEDDYPMVMRDLLTDLVHLSKLAGFSFDDALSNAVSMAEYELANPEE